jgi:predicted HTH transcriptional regulator
MFDSVEELMTKVRLGEDSSIELKMVYFRPNGEISGPDASSLADELAAFANWRAGVLLLGVDDKTHEVLGIPVERLDAVETFVRNVCNDRLKPALPVTILRIELPDSAGTPRAVLKVEVPRSLFVHQSPGGYFYRLGSSKRQMSPDLLARIFQQRSQARIIRFEEQAVPSTSMADLDPALCQRFTRGAADAVEGMLLKRSLLVRSEAGGVVASVAGVLMCCRDPERFLRSAYIEAVAYRGTAQDSNYQNDAARIRGPLDEQIRHAMVFFRRNNVVAARKTPMREDLPRFSERAVFEAVVNAVAHRDYSIHASKIRFFIFADRLQVYSPGALPNTVTVETIDARQATRNELITSLLADCPVPTEVGDVKRVAYMEKRGDGVPIIFCETRRLGAATPRYELLDESELLLTIPAAPLPGAEQ